MLKKIKNLVVQEEGQGLSEYGLVLAGVVVVVGVAVGLLKTEITSLFTNLLP
ncbi:Flp family type IVb pilin [Bacillus sp. ISL-75]|uniref:Flp family type IVb pilin n=1 Tax=Bacillus sp. ISL-75 TaxID=2819137 RepID=UPI001BE82921|nr:Flp family type IVb pilin [Bacillus sp. ISL-75]MBT2727435.1 Flp family type IVb pilin [Bacillus sp. ISL-75]